LVLRYGRTSCEDSRLDQTDCLAVVEGQAGVGWAGLWRSRRQTLQWRFWRLLLARR
jgi:hypothetical protein